MDVLLKVNSQSNGRDKLARLAQYTSRLIWHQLEIRNANKYSVDRIRNLESTLSTFRRILRLGRCLDICYTALDHMHHDDPWLRLTLTLSKVAHTLYLYSDHIVWLSRSGFLKLDSDQWNKTANKFWLVSLIANLAKDLYEIMQILEITKSYKFKQSFLITNKIPCYSFNTIMKHTCWIARNHKEILIDTIKDSCDLFIPLTSLGYVNFSPSTVGVLGAISSLAALVAMVQNILLRLGRCLDICYTALDHMHHDDPWLRLTLTLSKVAHTLYLYSDHIVWLSRSGFLKLDSDQWNKTANKFWLVSLIANLAKDLYEIMQILEITKSYKFKQSFLITNKIPCYSFNTIMKHTCWIARNHKEILIDTIKDSCDLFIPLTSLGYVNFSPSTVGVLGAISSLAALVAMVQNICNVKV